VGSATVFHHAAIEQRRHQRTEATTDQTTTILFHLAWAAAGRCLIDLLIHEGQASVCSSAVILTGNSIIESGFDQISFTLKPVNYWAHSMGP